jgi:hypothetical protein
MDISQVIETIPEEYLDRKIMFHGVVDRWCVWSAIRFVCEIVGVPREVQKSFPLWVPAGATVDAPYGPADETCPYPILSKGEPLSPRHLILIGWDLRTAILSLCEGV